MSDIGLTPAASPLGQGDQQVILGATTPDPSGDGKGPVPYDRFAGVVAERNQERTESTALKAELEKLRQIVAGTKQPEGVHDLNDPDLRHVVSDRGNEKFDPIRGEAMDEYFERKLAAREAKIRKDITEDTRRGSDRSNVEAQIQRDFGAEATNPQSPLAQEAVRQYQALLNEFAPYVGGLEKAQEIPRLMYGAFQQAHQVIQANGQTPVEHAETVRRAVDNGATRGAIVGGGAAEPTRQEAPTLAEIAKAKGPKAYLRAAAAQMIGTE